MTNRISPVRLFGYGLGLALLSMVGLSFARAASNDAPREHILFDSGWKLKTFEAPTFNSSASIDSWRWKWDNDNGKGTAPGYDSEGWQSSKSGDDSMNGRAGFAWFETQISGYSNKDLTVHFENVDDNAAIFLNGQKVGVHGGWGHSFNIPLGDYLKPGETNILAVRVQNLQGPGGIMGPVSLGTVGAKDNAFADQPDFDDSSWQTVQLPNDFVVSGHFTSVGTNPSHGSLPTPLAWYRKTFTLPDSYKGKSLWIDFDGVYRDSIVYLNGHKLGEHQSGYTSFRYDISNTANFGRKNVISVFVDPSDVEGWWYEGGGIYRHVWLNIADKVHVVPNSLYVHANLAEPGQTAPSGAEVDLESSVVNSTDQAMSGTFVSKIYDDRGKLVALSTSPIDAPAGESISVAQKINVENPRLWSLETPRCYRAEVSVKSGRHVLDNAKTEFGIRTIRYDANTGFYLNGKPVKIEGTCNHQDFPAVGIGMPDNLIWWRLKKLKEMGSNALRMSHNPPAAEMLEAADHLGMLVMDENRHLGDTYSDHTSSGTTYDDLSDLKDMILRDRNHPSIIMWSMCNEEWLQGSDEGAQIFTAMRDLVRKYDATRPVSCAMNGGWGSGISLVEDLVGFNYNPNVYDGYHRDHPSTPLFASETASRWTTRGVYKDDRDASTLSSYNFADDTWAPVAEKAFIAGSFVWTGFDYKGEPSPYSWPAVNSAFGILDMCGFPKDCFYYYKSWWQGSPVLHLMPHWNWKGQEGQDIRVVAYSNCDEVELFVNGKTVGRKSMPRNGHIEWDVPYQPGSIHAVGYNADKKIADEIVETTGEPAEIRLRSDMKTLDANNEDIAVVEASIVDSNGRVVPTANNLVTFRTSGVGHVAGVGNGDAGDHGWDKDSQRKAFNGYCAAIVGAETQSGTIEVTATAPGLKPAHFTINVNSPKK